jgi:hypothetical protein
VNVLLFLTSAVNRKNLEVRFHCKGEGQKLAKTLNKVLHCQKQKWQALLFTRNVSKIYLRPFEDSLTTALIKTGFKAWTTQRSIANKDFWADVGFEEHLKTHLKLELLSDATSETNGWQLLYGMPRRPIKYR